MFHGKIYTADKNFTRPLVAAVATNFKSVLYFLLLFAFKLRGIERKGRQEPEGSNEKVVKGEIDPSETFPNKNDPPCQEINGATEKWV